MGDLRRRRHLLATVRGWRACAPHQFRMDVADIEYRRPPMYHPRARTDAAGNPVPWPSIPKPPTWVPKQPRTAGKKVAPFVDNGREALEVLARLAGGTTFKDQAGGRTSRLSIGTDDVAHALGRVREPLSQRLALALACQTTAEWSSIQALAHGPLLAELEGNIKTRALVAGHRRFRARMVLHIVFHDLAQLRRPGPWAEGAKVLRMRRHDYQTLYESIRGFIITKAGAAAHEACRFLFGR